jgi:hypothetical protein
MRGSTKAIAFAAGAAAAAAIERQVFAAPRYRGPITDHFDGHRFYNPDPGWQSEGAFLMWMLNGSRACGTGSTRPTDHHHPDASATAIFA